MENLSKGNLKVLGLLVSSSSFQICRKRGFTATFNVGSKLSIGVLIWCARNDIHNLACMTLLPMVTGRKYQQVPSQDGCSNLQRFPNFFQVGTTFISQNVLQTALLLSPLKANCLRFSTTVCDTQFTLILFFLSFFLTNVQCKRTTRAEPEDHLWSADHSLGKVALT
jgi:hypothetical protein